MYFIRGTRTVLARCQEYLKGLFHECKSNIERMAERIPASTYQSLHHFISHSEWDGLGVMDEVARQTAASFALLPPGRTGLLLDESDWEKSGRKSVGVSRQYIGNVGKVTNAQVGVFAALSKGEHVGLVSARLFLPSEWASDAARCTAAGIPLEAQLYRTKPELAIEMLRALPPEVGGDWVGGDSVYGNSPTLRRFLVAQNRAFVLDVGQNLGVYLVGPQPFVPQKTAKAGRTPARFSSEQKPVLLTNLLNTIAKEQWQTLGYRQGAKGMLRREAALMDVRSWMAWHHHIALTMMALHFTLHARIEQKDELPLLSCPDVKLLLAKKLQNKLDNPTLLEEAILKRQRQRLADKLRYYLRI